MSDTPAARSPSPQSAVHASSTAEDPPSRSARPASPAEPSTPRVRQAGEPYTSTLGLTLDSSLRDALLTIHPAVVPLAHTIVGRSESCASLPSPDAIAQVDRPEELVPDLVPMRVVVDAVIKEALEEKAKDLLETMLKPADLDSSLTELANRQVELSSAIHGLLSGLARFKKHPTPYSLERDVDAFVVELTSSLGALHGLLALLAHEPNLPAPTRSNYASGIVPDWVMSRGMPGTSDPVIEIIGENKAADASSANGLFAPIRTFTRTPAGVEWSAIPVTTGSSDKSDAGREHAAGLRVMFSKNLAITLYDLPKALTHVYVSTSEIFFALMITLSHSSTSASPIGVPYLYTLTPFISLGQHGLLLVLYFLATRPDEMRHGVARAIQSAARFAPLRAELARHGLTVSDALPPLPSHLPKPSVGGETAAPSDAEGSVDALDPERDDDDAEPRDDDDAEPRGRKRRVRSSPPAPPSPKHHRREDSPSGGGAGGGGVGEGDGAAGAAASVQGLSGRSERKCGVGGSSAHGAHGEGASDEGQASERSGGTQRDAGGWQHDRFLLRWQYGSRPLKPTNSFRRIPPPPLSQPHSQSGDTDRAVKERVRSVYPSPMTTPPKPPRRTTARLTALLPPIVYSESAMTMYAQDGPTRYVIKATRTHVESLRGEAALLARASDAGLSPLFLGLYVEDLDEGTEKGPRVVLLMEDGGTAMQQSFNELCLDKRERLYTLVHTMHRLGIWHDDLAPRNILVNPSGEFKICDFGRSRLHECEGEGKCGELEDLRCELQLETGGEGGSGVGRAGGGDGEDA